MFTKTLAAGAAGLATAAAIVASPAGAAAPVASAHRATTVINECATAHYRPRHFTLTCADGNIVITRARYSMWDATSAAGHGRYVYNTCTPSCADGTDRHHPVRFQLYRARTVRGQRVFTRMVVQYAGLAEVFQLPTRAI